MDKYGRYLHHMQEIYFKDILKIAFPDATCHVTDTYWEHIQTLPFRIVADIDMGGEQWEGILEYRAWSVNGYETHYGVACLDIYKPYESEEHIQVIVNPSTLESDIAARRENREEEFYKELAYWPESFTSERWNNPMDGHTIPDLRDVVLTYAQKVVRKGNSR